MTQIPPDERNQAHEFNSATARTLADLGGLSHDLNRTLLFITRLIEESDQVLQDALFTAALITYRRCFNSGTRLILSSSDVIGLHPQATEIHDHYLAMADKFAAHSVNPFEQMKVGVLVVENQVFGVNAFFMRLITHEKNNLHHWANLVSLLNNKIAETARATEEKLLAEAKTRPISEIVRGGPLTITVPANPKERR